MCWNVVMSYESVRRVMGVTNISIHQFPLDLPHSEIIAPGFIFGILHRCPDHHIRKPYPPLISQSVGSFGMKSPGKR